MSAHATHFDFALTREEAAESYFDEELAEAARQMLAGGNVGFKLSTRVGPHLMSWWRWSLYQVFVRDPRIPEALRSAPLPAMQRGLYFDWHAALAACTSADDQLLVMTVGRAKSADTWDLPVECRPRDEADKKRFLTLQSVFENYSPASSPGLAEAVAELEEVARMAKDA